MTRHIFGRRLASIVGAALLALLYAAWALGVGATEAAAGEADTYDASDDAALVSFGITDSGNVLRAPVQVDVIGHATPAPLRPTREQVAPNGLGDDLLGGLRQCFRSFSAETEVLMADGRTKPISEVEVGDWVVAEDPEAGDRGPRRVTHLWVHDDVVFDLEVDGHDLATTEDHPFWNQTDGEWQRADALEIGDHLLAANGQLLTVGAFDSGSSRTTTAYNLSIEGIHTYFVGAGESQVLVHNTGCDEAAERIQREIGGEIHTFRPPEGVPLLGEYALSTEPWSYHTVVVSGGRVFDDFTGVAGLPIDDWKALWTHGDQIDFGF